MDSLTQAYPALLVTKHYIPRLRSSYVPRPHLLNSLESGLQRKLILIAAAAGFGKTMLVADWSMHHADEICWFSLDEGDNDPTRFLSYIVAAVQSRQPDIGVELLAALQSPQSPAVENVLRILINQIAALSQRFILVLDDYHVIENQVVHAALNFLLEHLPPNLHLLLLTRTDPPLPLARLRVRDDLLELRAAQLRFSVEEAADFLNHTLGIQLPDESIRALEARTEGWIAGLQLAALALQSQSGDQTAFVQNFTGSHRFILDYLIEEVLSQQPENVRRFLLQTSILGRLNGALCSAVTGDEGGQAMLEHLERSNLFLIPLDPERCWYRYHHLFADLLAARLQAEYVPDLKTLRQRAAHWHAANHLPEEAVLYALAAEDFEYAAELMTGSSLGVMHRGEVATLLEWYRAFPPDFVAARPRLALQFGMAFALNGRWDEAENLLTIVDQSPTADFPPSEALLFAYLVASYRQDAARLTAIAQAAAEARPDRVTKLVLGLVLSLKGDLRAACERLTESQEASEREGDVQLALSALFHQCRFQVFLGNLHRAYALSHQALERIGQLGGAALPLATMAYTTLGRIGIEWNQLDEAEENLSQAIRVAERSGLLTGMVSSATLMLAEVQQARGDFEAAAQSAQLAITHAEKNDPPAEIIWLKTYQARIGLGQGNIAAAADWLHTVQKSELSTSLFYPPTILPVTQARLLLAQRKADAAVELLTRLTAQPQDLLTVEALNLLALARWAQGDNAHALLTLEQALRLAEPENRVRAFLDLGAPLAKLLGRFVELNPNHAYARTLLAAFPAQSESSPTIDSLGERELEILRLIAAGHSNEEIAQKVVLALSTVKWYINVLYGKLHVKNRAQAVAIAHERHLV